MSSPGMISLLLLITLITAVFFQSTTLSNVTAANTLSTIMGTTSTILAAGMVYVRHRQVTEVSSYTGTASVLLLVNYLAMVAAVITFLCFLVSGVLYICGINVCSVIGDILVYGFGSLYIWLQCLLTSYLSSFYYSKNLTLLRLTLCFLSVVIFAVMLISGIAANIINRGTSEITGAYAVNVFCHHLAATVFCIFLMTYHRDHRHLDATLQNDLLLDDMQSVGSSSYPQHSSSYVPVHIFTHTSESLRRSLTSLIS